MMTCSSKSNGFILLPVILVVTMIAVIAYSLSRDNGMNVNIISAQMDIDRARYAAEAGLQAVNAKIQDNDCKGFYHSRLSPLKNRDFGGAAFSAYATPAYSNPVKLISTGTYNGTTVKLERNNVRVYQATPKSYTLQPDNKSGSDSYIQVGSHNYNGENINLGAEAGNSYPLLQFDLSILPAESLLIQSFFSIYANSKASSDPLNIYRVTSSWEEGDKKLGVNWFTRDGTLPWTTPGGDYHNVAVSSLPNFSEKTWLEFDVTDLTRAWMLGRYSNYGFMMASVSAPAYTHLLSSDEKGKEPKINFSYLEVCDTTKPWIFF